MPTVHAFHIVPELPAALDGLRTAAYNLRWAWNHDAIALFRKLDSQLWTQTHHNPVQMLGSISPQRLENAANDEEFLAHLDRVLKSNDAYMKAAEEKRTWFQQNYADKSGSVTIGYFSMEFGISECLPIYSGGLGILAGDHLKSASDLDLPLIAVGLLYQQGYFRQSLNSEGWQQERYPDNDFYNMPLTPVNGEDGLPLTIGVEFPGRTVYAQIWKVQVGRIPLYLMDTNIPQNSPADQNITDQLYGGDTEMRLKQELILGIGGLRALTALGITPTVCHMNEGHSAFLALERTRMLMQEQGLTYRQAQELVAAGNLFTTHTPVPAGFDVFSTELLKTYFAAYATQLGLTFEEFLGLGRVNRTDSAEQFNMAVLALRHAHSCNGVSALHGDVTRKMAQAGYPGFPKDEVPVGHVTNGIHTCSFLSEPMKELLDQFLGSHWDETPWDKTMWAKVDDIPDDELWKIREASRARTIDYARMRLKQQYENRGMSDHEIRQTRDVLDPHALTIGFARRFATYKRATLLLSDEERLLRMLNHPERPVQFLLAGKAHPRDDGGKELIQRIARFARRPEARKRIIFIEDYDMSVARHLVQGVDVWLNNPRRPMEASGTSGMKVLANGGLNCSILDGWWAEAYDADAEAGWAIGKGEDYNDPGYQDYVEAGALYSLLEEDIIPLFYNRNTDGLPRNWIKHIKNSMRTHTPVYNTHRMVREYAETFYLPASARYQKLRDNNLERAKSLVAWKERVRTEWPAVRIERVETPASSNGGTFKVGAPLKVTAFVRLGGLSPEEVQVQAYHGALDVYHEIVKGAPSALAWQADENGLHRYEGEIRWGGSGLQGFHVRVLPTHPDAALPNELALVTWE